jgi:hypothetical protein
MSSGSVDMLVVFNPSTRYMFPLKTSFAKLHRMFASYNMLGYAIPKISQAW